MKNENTIISSVAPKGSVLHACAAKPSISRQTDSFSGLRGRLTVDRESHKLLVLVQLQSPQPTSRVICNHLWSIPDKKGWQECLWCYARRQNSRNSLCSTVIVPQGTSQPRPIVPQTDSQAVRSVQVQKSRRVEPDEIPGVAPQLPEATCHKKQSDQVDPRTAGVNPQLSVPHLAVECRTYQAPQKCFLRLMSGSPTGMAKNHDRWCSLT